jgi:hypothetical protein
MADGDFYSRNLPPKWRKVGNTLGGGHELAVVCGLASEAFADSMRRSDGIPGLGRLRGAFAAAARDGDRDAWRATSEPVRRDARHHPNTELAAMAGQKLLETDADRLRRMSAGDLDVTLAKASVEGILQHHLVRSRQPKLPAAYTSAGELQAHEREVIRGVDTAGLARELLRHEDGQGFRAPARRTASAGTEQLLDRPLRGPS